MVFGAFTDDERRTTAAFPGATTVRRESEETDRWVFLHVPVFKVPSNAAATTLPPLLHQEKSQFCITAPTITIRFDG